MANQRYVYAASSSSAVPFHSASQRQSTVFSIHGSSINHANLRRHLSPDEQQLQDPPPLVRQGAFMLDDAVDPVCRICFGVTEDMENSQFVRRCQCRGSMYVQHHPLLNPSQPPLPSSQLPLKASSSLSAHHHPLLPPSPHQEFHDIPSSDMNHNNHNNNINNHLFLHSGNVHDECLKNWITSTGATTRQQCNTCLHEYTLPSTSSLEPQRQLQSHHPSTVIPSTSSSSTTTSASASRPPAFFSLPVLSSSSPKKSLGMGGLGYFTRTRCILYTMGFLLFLSLSTESIRCTEVRKVSGAEIDDSPEAPFGRPDYIWLPIVDWECWRASYIGQGWTFIHYILGQPYTLLYFLLFIPLLYLAVIRFHHMPSTAR